MVAEFARSGWSKLELSDEHARVLLGSGRPEPTGAGFRARAADRGVAFPQGHLDLHADVTASPEVVSRIREWIDLFLSIGIRSGVIHPGGRTVAAAGLGPDRVHEARVRAFGELCEHVKGTDFVICLENVPDAPMAEDLERIIGDVGSRRLGICLDTGHLNLASGDVGTFIRRAGGDLRALHIADNDGSADQHLMPFGLGTVDWESFARSVAAVGYTGLLNFEIPGERRAPLALRRAKLDYLRAVSAHLLDLIEAAS